MKNGYRSTLNQFFNGRKHLILLAFLFPVLTKAQPTSIIDTSLVWDITSYERWDRTNFFPKDVRSEYYFFQGDTLIDDTLYHVLVARQHYFSTVDGNGNSHEDTNLYGPVNKAFFFDDPLENITYMRLPQGSRAFPRFYNNPSVGDTITYWFLDVNEDYTTKAVVKSINPQQYFGKTVNRVELGSDDFFLTHDAFYITGLGGQNGLVHFLQYNEGYDYSVINCIQKGDAYRRFDRPASEQCEFQHDPTNIQYKTRNSIGFNVFPNPTNTGKIHYSIASGTEAYSIRIVDQLGKTVYTEYDLQRKDPLEVKSIDITSLEIGFYNIVIINKTGERFSKSFLKY
ncbi:MAG: T9SS type A sorting domain-containing protein [Luteibaculum sp.]